MLPNLTPRQQQILDYIRKRQQSGISPTYREIGDRFGINTPNGVLCHIKALEKKGYLEREHNSRARSIRLTEAGKPRTGIPLLSIYELQLSGGW